jgi:oxygen-independent coproporphyrinogen-3 oxidase
MGIGAGAHGKYTCLESQRIIRRQKTRLPEHYLNYSTHPNGKTQTVDSDELSLEFMMNALRLNEGVPMAYFEQRTQLPLAHIETVIKRLQAQGLIENDTQQLSTTNLGHRFLNTVLESFEPDT